MMLFSPALTAQNTYTGAQSLKAQFKGKTKPLSELTPRPGSDLQKRAAKKANKPSFTPPNFLNYEKQAAVNPDALPKGLDPVRQDNLVETNVPVEPNFVVEGIDEATSNVGVPDTNGDAGPDHYVQIVNASWFQVFDKEGTPLTDAISANTIWNEIGQQSFSDPLILYDEAAQRWLLTDLASFDIVLYGVSETSDPMGAWNLYTLTTPGFADYPKYGIWPNSYIFTINEGQGTYPVYAINRQQMLDGAATIDVQRVDIPGLNGGFPTATPMDWNSPTPPPTDEVFVARINDDAWGNGNNNDLLEVWTINVDWANPNNTSFSSQELITAPYDSDGCTISGGFGFECLPQPGSNQGIDGIMTIIMHNIAYWNFQAYESAVLAFSVDAGNEYSGIRWMELRRSPGEDWTIYQEGTYAPDNENHRFIPAIGINGKGDIGLGYSVVGDNTFPSLRYTGRRLGDPLGTMTIDEYEFATGTGSREGTDRFGDYAKMSVDPINGSFWFTSEYAFANGSFGTKIVNFSLTRDTFDLAPVNLVTPQNSPDLTDSEVVTVEVRNLGLEPASNFSVGYIFENGTPVIEAATIPTLQPDSIYTHTFAGTVDMDVIGDYEFEIFSIFSEDQNLLNDTLRLIRKKLPRFDAGVTGIDGLDGLICASSINADFMVTNFGTEVLTSLDLNYTLNGNTMTEAWTGNLQPGESTTVTITLTPLIDGTNTIEANTSNPNGMADEIPGNDSFERDFLVELNGVDVTLTLTLDFFATETSWILSDENNNILYQGGPYGFNDANATFVEEWCLSDGGCYTYTIFDSYGDGLDSPFGDDGTYSITDADGNVLASIINVNFGYDESNDFCVEAPCAIAATFDITPESAPNVGNGAILVTPNGGTAPFTYSLDGGMAQADPLFVNLNSGDYTILITDAVGCTYEEEVTVPNLNVSTEDVLNPQEIAVNPNPSENGAFWITVKGFDNGGLPLEVQILDQLGRPVLYDQIAGVDDYHKGIVSLANYPAGVYYIRFQDKNIRQLVPIVRL